jgi:hypothetical protein
MIEQLFGSKTRVKLLQLFYSNPNRQFYVREITRKIDEQINSVRRELANLLSIGLIGSEDTNNKLYYEVNQKYEYYQPLSAIFGGGGSAMVTTPKRAAPVDATADAVGVTPTFQDDGQQANPTLATDAVVPAQPAGGVTPDGAAATPAPVKTAVPNQFSDAAEIKSLGNVEIAVYTGQFTRDEATGVDVFFVGDLNHTKLQKFMNQLESKEGKELRYTSMSLGDFQYRQQIKDRFVSNVMQAKKQVLIDKHNSLKA